MEEHTWEFVAAKMEREGMPYVFQHYHDFREVQDVEFHALREQYVRSADDLEGCADDDAARVVLGDTIDPTDDEEVQEYADKISKLKRTLERAEENVRTIKKKRATVHTLGRALEEYVVAHLTASRACTQAIASLAKPEMNH